jgi:3-deoxy-7-phosphoheptulonate synthase
MSNPAPASRPVDDVRIRAIMELSTPAQVIGELPGTAATGEVVFGTRQSIHRILHGADDRLLVVVGPCSIHDPAAALEYAARLLPLRRELCADLEVVMRVYFEKPRTTVGWKGLINDPGLDGSFDINRGLRIGRRLLLDVNAAGMPVGVEFLDTQSPQYIADLVSWGAIGARTTESQVHRELASGMSCPIGFKNGTDGNAKIAVDAIKAASSPHHFLSITKGGISAIVSTEGNEDCHIILRGGKEPNYDAKSIGEACADLGRAGLAQRLMIDCSHANSRKDYRRQIEVAADVAGQVAGGDERIFGVMIESHLNPGRQDLVAGKPLAYGVSITDGCIGWDETVPTLHSLAAAVRARRLALAAAAE